MGIGCHMSCIVCRNTTGRSGPSVDISVDPDRKHPCTVGAGRSFTNPTAVSCRYNRWTSTVAADAADLAADDAAGVDRDEFDDRFRDAEDGVFSSCLCEVLRFTRPADASC